GGPTAVYASGTTGPIFYRHADWLGSSRLASTQSRTKYFDVSYAPFGENYNNSGTTDYDFTGENQDTEAGYYDFLFREYSPLQGRWMSPDPAGTSAVDPTNPQSWNRYAYVLNNPLALTDPLGLWCVWGDGTHDDDPENGGASKEQCNDQGGYWDPTDSVTECSDNTGGCDGGAFICGGILCYTSGITFYSQTSSTTIYVTGTITYTLVMPSSLNNQIPFLPSPVTDGPAATISAVHSPTLAQVKGAC